MVKDTKKKPTKKTPAKKKTSAKKKAPSGKKVALRYPNKKKSGGSKSAKA